MMKNGKFWIALVIAFLSFDVLAGMTLVYFAHTDPSLGIEEDYYNKAVHWDEHREQLSRNKALGWTLAFKATESKGAEGAVGLTAYLSDRLSKPITDAHIQLTVYHNARSDARQPITLVEVSPGKYQGAFTARKYGWWVFDAEVQQGSDTFTMSDRLFIRPDARAK